ncbi:cysteine-rich receptor-like protein kinase 44 isoform X2 [Phragmites australis]|uniref:cysteine-rich receptor-like protein kinase 44 isoform X2 n=1 Tax=Phragmites australis TaxID=29695 RepID=UPI002D783D6E|nr:cysteine-rich receptor-like protein kinase 44 isoform X2 [Phragmites australis]
MALWNGVGQVASIAQLAGVDAYGLISMIVEAAQTVKRNRETCQLLARRTRMIGALLQQLERTQLMQHTETRIPVEQLEETLRHAYMLIASCREGSYLHSCFMGGKQAEQLCEVQNEITFYLQLFPLVSFVDTTRTWERLLNRDSPLCTEPSEHAIHNSDYNNRLRTKDLKVTIFEDSGTHPHRESEEKKTEGQVMDMGELANLIGGGKGAELSYFCFSQILAATDNLSERNLIGIGAFGYVYKGKLPNCLDFAVKRHDASSFRGPDMFRTEIEVIPNLQHKNIISLLGYCVQGGEKMLVYEYMPNKSLASIIADETKRKLLNWSKRLQIIKAIADGLAYLHGRSQICIVHRDIKPSNILLDHEMNAKISDFGLALQLAPNTTAEVLVCGTYGYADPEYVATGNISEKADVYAFGIVLLEIICGKLFRSYEVKAKGTSLGLRLPDCARRYEKKLHKFVDPLLGAKKHERVQIKECVKVALLCIHKFANSRPTMSEVVAMLGSIKVVRQ